MEPATAILTGSIVLSLAAVIGSLANAFALVRQMHLKLRAELARETERFDFEKRLAFVRVRLDRAAIEWRRKADFAETTLASFYRTAEVLGEVRVKPPGSTRSFSDYRAIKAALDRHKDMLVDLQTRKHIASALFGEAGGDAYQQVIGIVTDVRTSSNTLAEAAFADKDVGSAARIEHENTIWAAPQASDDPVVRRFNQAIAAATDLFGAALVPPIQETAP